MSQLRVGIVGAGLAGLRAADVLHKAGVDVRILEARNRVGGRTVQATQLGKLLDLGPNWIHGTENNPIFELAQSIPNSTYVPGESQTISPNGELLPQPESDALQAAFWKEIAYGQEFSKRFSKFIPSTTSLYDFCAHRASKLYDKTSDGGMRNYINFMATVETWGAFVGSDARKQSLKFFFLEELLDGSTVFMASSYGPILKVIAETAEQKNLIQFDTVVEEVRSEQLPDQKKQVVVVATTGECHMFDAVIVTIPLGCLKQNLIKFYPELPAATLKSINALGYGHLEKAYVTFHFAWWEEANPNFDSIFMLQPENSESESVCAFSLSRHPEPFRQPTLLFYFYGSLSQRLVSLPLSSTPEGQTALFEFLNPYFSKIPGFSSISERCKPLAATRTDWSNDRLAGNGSYSNFQIGLENGLEDIATIRAGVESEHVWFAGEHVAPLVGLGTATGAYWAGEIAASRVMRKFGLVTGVGSIESPQRFHTPAPASWFDGEDPALKELLNTFAPEALA